jgi:hypothetical protein
VPATKLGNQVAEFRAAPLCVASCVAYRWEGAAGAEWKPLGIDEFLCPSLFVNP